MKILDNKKDCVGCGLCVNICPNNCIGMECENDGFWYPKIDTRICISCGKCKRTCPVNKPKIQIQPNGCYALKDNDKTSRKKSSSGAASAVFYQQIIRQGGAFCGVKLNNELHAVHDLTCCMEDIDLYRDSKYVQSNMCEAWDKIADCLEHGQKVLVTGTPCQIAAVHSRFSDTDNLILVDFICSGVPDPSLFELYKKDLEDRKGQPLKKFYFRDKTNGWKESNIRVVYTDETEDIITRDNSDYFQLFGNNLFFRECCYECRFKAFNTYADLTIGDYWGIEKLYPELDDDSGCSVVIVNTQKGKQFFETSTKNCVIKSTPLEFAIETHPKLIHSISKNPYRNQFYNIYKKGNTKLYHKAIKRCIGTSMFNKVMRKLLLKIKKQKGKRNLK